MLIPALMMAASFLGGLSKRKAAQESAASDEENAISAKVQGYFTERGMKLEREALLSQIRNRASGAGLDVNQGSPLEAYLQASRETELDILHVRSNAGREVAAYRSRAKSLRKAGDQELFGSMLSGAGDVMKFNYLKDKASFKPSQGKG
jgi:hypothetical protein